MAKEQIINNVPVLENFNKINTLFSEESTVINLNSTSTIDMDAGGRVQLQNATLTAPIVITAISNASGEKNEVYIKINDPDGNTVTFDGALSVTTQGQPNTSQAYGIILKSYSNNGGYEAIYVNSEVLEAMIVISGYTGLLAGLSNQGQVNAILDQLKLSQLAGTPIRRNFSGTSFTLDLDTLGGNIAELDFGILQTNPTLTFSNGSVGATYVIGIRQNHMGLTLNVDSSIGISDPVTVTDDETTFYQVHRFSSNVYIMIKISDITVPLGTVNKEVFLSMGNVSSSVPTRTDSKIWDTNHTLKNLNDSKDLINVSGVDTGINMVNDAGFQNGNDGHDTNVVDVDSFINELVGLGRFSSDADQAIGVTNVGWTFENLDPSKTYTIAPWLTDFGQTSNQVTIRFIDGNGIHDFDFSDTSIVAVNEVIQFLDHLIPDSNNEIVVRVSTDDASIFVVASWIFREITP